MEVKAFNTYYKTHCSYELTELRNRLYDMLVDQYEDSGILICDSELDKQVDELIENMMHPEDLWEEFEQ